MLREKKLGTASPTMELYDLGRDISESTDVSGSNPEIVAQIEQIMAEAHTLNPNFKLLYDELNA